LAPRMPAGGIFRLGILSCLFRPIWLCHVTTSTFSMAIARCDFD